MIASWKRTFLTNPLLGLPHVFILTPFWVPVNVTVLTVTFCTPASFKSFPKLPMLQNPINNFNYYHYHKDNNNKYVNTYNPLITRNNILKCIKVLDSNLILVINKKYYLIPCPGPQAMFSIHKLVVPGPTEMQSSPVRIFELRMVMWDDICTWMPSVLGLFPSARTFTPCSFTFWHPLNTMWNIWLFIEVNPPMAMLLELVNASV